MLFRQRLQFKVATCSDDKDACIYWHVFCEELARHPMEAVQTRHVTSSALDISGLWSHELTHVG